LALAALPVATRNAALEAMAQGVAARRGEILAANERDRAAARDLVAAGRITQSDAKRLDLSGAKFDAVIEGLRSVASLPDPLGRVQIKTELDEGLVLERVSCPIGVIAVIFESRPDALPQIASLCLKSGNALLLKGGSEARESNRILAQVLDDAARTVAGIPAGWITLLERREEIAEILKLDEFIDLIIPRGGNALCRYIMENTRIPVTGHRDGICHTYVHAGADAARAVRLAVDGKCQYPAVCNATETLLFDRASAGSVMPAVLAALEDKGVALRLDPVAKTFVADPARYADATEEDWRTEYLDLVLSVRVVADLGEAIAHINRYGSHHTDTIVTENADAAERFLAEVDSASVMHNASTRFADGFRYGLGAEVGISTGKLHSRGPVGLEGLTIYKYILRGTGQIVADYSGADGRKFTHRRLQ
jgi:glutamate-5-semialdehyde dehydrogenase